MFHTVKLRSDLLYVSENRYRVECRYSVSHGKTRFHTVKHLLYVSENRYRVEISDLISESISQNLVLVSNPRFYSVNPTGLCRKQGYSCMVYRVISDLIVLPCETRSDLLYVSENRYRVEFYRVKPDLISYMYLKTGTELRYQI